MCFFLLFFFFLSLKVLKKIKMCAQKSMPYGTSLEISLGLSFYHITTDGMFLAVPGPAEAQATEHLWNSLAWGPCLCQSHQPSRDSPGPQQVISHTFQVA